VLTVSYAVAGQCDERSSFMDFLSRFSRDQQFRNERIVFPLRVVVGSPSEGQIKQRWSENDIGSKFNPPIPSQQLREQGVTQYVSWQSSTEVEVKQSIPESDSYIVIYRFKLRSGCWFMVRYEDSSY